VLQVWTNARVAERTMQPVLRLPVPLLWDRGVAVAPMTQHALRPSLVIR
jgi:hypothetical protein